MVIPTNIKTNGRKILNLKPENKHLFYLQKLWAKTINRP